MEYKVNLLAPARGEVVTTGRRWFVCRSEVSAVADGEERACALMLQTVSLSPASA